MMNRTARQSSSRRRVPAGETPPADSPEREAQRAYQRALRRLARRDQSEDEIRDRLLADGYAKDAVGAALTRLKEARYVDDGGLAERFARSRLAHHGLGRHRIRAALKRRGVPAALAEKGLASALADVSERDAVEALARRYWRERTRDEPRARLRKLWAFLMRRGFPADLVHARLRALWPRLRDALDGLEPAEGTPE